MRQYQVVIKTANNSYRSEYFTDPSSDDATGVLARFSKDHSIQGTGLFMRTNATPCEKHVFVPTEAVTSIELDVFYA